MSETCRNLGKKCGSQFEKNFHSESPRPPIELIIAVSETSECCRPVYIALETIYATHGAVNGSKCPKLGKILKKCGSQFQKNFHSEPPRSQIELRISISEFSQRRQHILTALPPFRAASVLQKSSTKSRF